MGSANVLPFLLTRQALHDVKLQFCYKSLKSYESRAGQLILTGL